MLKAGEKKMGNSIFLWWEPSLAALFPFSRDMKELSGEARVGLEKWLTWQPFALIMFFGDDDDDDKAMITSAATDNSSVDDEANSVTFFSSWNLNWNFNVYHRTSRSFGQLRSQSPLVDEWEKALGTWLVSGLEDCL